MATIVQVLAANDCEQVHQKSLEILANTGLRVDTERGRKLLIGAGATPAPGKDIIRFPPALVETSLKLAPRHFSLGGRRLGWSLPMNALGCSLIADGGAIYALDELDLHRRVATWEDWLMATRVTDVLDEFGCYWGVVDGIFGTHPVDRITQWIEMIRNFSKHIQESAPVQAGMRWLPELLSIVFGQKEIIRDLHPVSFLISPNSPLVVGGDYTDAYLETVGLDIPVALMPMPLMGTTGPGTLISNLVLANCEVLAQICLIQVAQPGTPIIYASIPAISNPYTGRFGSGEVEHSLLGAAVVEIARYYQLPVEASTGGSDHHFPGIQAGYERALNFALPVLSKPDLLVAPGLLGGSMIFSPAQFMIDLEIIRRCRRLSQGIGTDTEKWLDEVIDQVGPGGDYISQRSTRAALRAGELYISSLGCHDPYERWVAGNKPDILEEAREQFSQIALNHQPLPLDENVDKELSRLKKYLARVSD